MSAGKNFGHIEIGYDGIYIDNIIKKITLNKPCVIVVMLRNACYISDTIAYYMNVNHNTQRINAIDNQLLLIDIENNLKDVAIKIFPKYEIPNENFIDRNIKTAFMSLRLKLKTIEIVKHLLCKGE